jgi:hypothetical protein
VSDTLRFMQGLHHEAANRYHPNSQARAEHRLLAKSYQRAVLRSTTMNIINEINNELNRLQVGTNADPYSGLMAEETEGGVRVFDDYASGLYEPEVLQVLKDLNPEDVTLASNDPNNIWEWIRPYEV